MKSIKAIFRRGQTSTKLDGQIHTPEDLSRSSSVTNLNVDQASPKNKTTAAKPRKSSSRDKLDKIVSGTGTTERKNDRKGISKNNNKFEPGDQSLTLDSLQELDSLKSQLHQMATEKSSLALKLGEQKGQIHSLQHQIENLKMYQEQSSLQLEQLTDENTALRNRLRDVAHSPLSDNEKQQLLYESHRHHNSAPASIATNPMEDGTCGDVTACPTPDWDKHSSSNVSEVSVACLQDKINQMQETHYSTNEELQATLQELTDLQRQLKELQQENERLLEEKNLMFDSLCRQTERLKDTRHEVESLKTVIYREQNDVGVDSAQEREDKLVDLLKFAQDEQDSLLSKHEQLTGELQELRDANEALDEQLKALSDRNGTLESTLDAKHAEQKLLDQELAQARDQCNGKQIEVNRLRDLLENARTKINELEQDRALSDKSELDELLDNARKEKDALESEVANLKEQLARSKNEIDKLKEQISILQEECKVTRNNARTIQSDLEYKYEKLVSEKVALTEQLHKFQDIINELQVQAQCQEEDKRNLSDVLAETQRNLSESERKIAMLENELSDVKKLRKDENEEWEKFQNDLLTSVRVANDFKTEAQQDLQKMIMENKEHRDKVRLLEAQLDKLKGDPAMPERRRNSQTFSKQNVPKRIFGSLPNLLDSVGDKDNPVKGSKRPKWMRHQKQLSQGEEKILESLHTMYKEIDPNKPDDMLTSEQALVKKLKTLYEDESMAYKPVAPRRKHDLAISKPLLESVYSNPKLESIARDPNLKSLENDRFSWMGHKRFSDDRLESQGSAKVNSDTKQSSPKSDDTKRFVSYLPTTSPEVSQRLSHTSVDQRRFSSIESSKGFPLRRYSSKEDLTGIAELESFKSATRKALDGQRSSLKSHHSDSSSNISQKKRVSFDERRNSCLVIKEFLSFESLENIYQNIDPQTPEEKLTKEQRFAVRVKSSMGNLDKKPELRKRPTFKKSRVIISSPLKESVLRNTKLFSIIKDPIVRNAGENPEQEMVELRKVHRMKKYLGDINRVLKNPTRRMCKRDSRLSKSLEDLHFAQVFKRISSSMENLPSDGVKEPEIEIKVVTKVLPAKCFAASLNVSTSSSSVDNSVENLTDASENTPVVFIEHFEPEKHLKNKDQTKKRESKEETNGVQIKDITEDRRSVSEDDEYTGRVSFPEEGEVCRMRLLSINSVEMDEDDVLARYQQISEFKEEESDRDSYVPNAFADDSQSFYSVELTNAEEKTSVQPEALTNEDGEENWLNKILDQNCDVEDRKDNRKMRVLYKDVVKEIKRKYSQDVQSSSDEEDVHIFNPKEGKVEVRRLSEEDDSNFFDRFFKTKQTFPEKNEYENVESRSSQEKEKGTPILEEHGSSAKPFEATELDYIRNVRETYKEEFEEVYRLGITDVESDYRKILLRQDALDYTIENSGIDQALEEKKYSSSSYENPTEESVLSRIELKLLSSVKKRDSRPLSDINMADLDFIESMRRKYLNDELATKEKPISAIKLEEGKASYSDISQNSSSSYSSYYLENSTEKKKSSNILPEEKHLKLDTFSSESAKSEYLKQCTDDFLNREKEYSSIFWEKEEAISSGSLSYIKMDDQDFIESLRKTYLKEDFEENNASDIPKEDSTSFSSYYLKLSTENFLMNEVTEDHWRKEKLISLSPLSGMNMTDLDFIESMRKKYFNEDPAGDTSNEEKSSRSINVERYISRASIDASTSYTSYYLENSTENHLEKNFEEELPHEEPLSAESFSSASARYEYLKQSTNDFLTREKEKAISWELLSNLRGSDLDFIESMRKKYWDESLDGASHTSDDGMNEKPITSINFDNIKSSDSPDAVPSYSAFYLNHLTENFLKNEKSFNIKLLPDEKRSQTETFASTSANNEYQKHLTNDFLKRGKDHSSKHLKEEKTISSTLSNKIPDATTFSYDYLIYLTTNFLIEEINHNTYFELSNVKKKWKADSSHKVPSRSSARSSRRQLFGPDQMETTENKVEIRQRKHMNIVQDSSNAEFISRTNLVLRNSKERFSGDYEPVYANSKDILHINPSYIRVNPRKPKPLPRKASRDTPSNITSIQLTSGSSSVTQTVDNVTVVSVKNAPQELLPNSSKIMAESDKTSACVVPKSASKYSLEETSSESLAKPIKGSSNVTVRKTKKFIKGGDQVEEFGEASGANYVENTLDNEKFDLNTQVIPDHLIDYADSESKVTLFDVDNAKFSAFQESCSRPQTSRQRSTPFRISYYGEDDDEDLEDQEANPRASKENVSRLKQKFESLNPEDELERRRRSSQKSNLGKFFNDKAAYDLVFKTGSKYWFDNISETDSTLQSTSTFEPSSTENPLNITILDPIESKTNANYQHLFESEASNIPLQKPFVSNLKLSELNLRTSIPCVDFTTAKEKKVELGSNASLYNHGLGNERSSRTDIANCKAKDK